MSDLKYPIVPPILAAAKTAGYPPVVAGAPRAMAHASETPEIAVKVEPVLVEWKRPWSEETQISPVTVGFTTIFTGAVEAPKVLVTAKVFPPLTET